MLLAHPRFVLNMSGCSYAAGLIVPAPSIDTGHVGNLVHQNDVASR